jgi:pyridoxal 5'-phosphate synthase pdxT subunit
MDGRLIGILALQGDYSAHRSKLFESGVSSIYVRKPSELEAVAGLIIPGGESTAMLKLMTPELQSALTETVSSGLPTLATCAGLILIACRVYSPEQESMNLIDLDITRNAYGRQVDSFVDHSLSLTASGARLAEKLDSPADRIEELEGIFIRAPEITRVGSKVEILAELNSSPVLVKSGNIIGATFHPELSKESKFVHQLLLSGIQ